MAKDAKKVKKDDLVEVVGTGKSKFIKKGQKVTVHSIQAEKLIKSGKAGKSGDEKKVKG